MFFWSSCFFDDPVDVGNLISGSSAFSKITVNIWNFMVHILLKRGLENFEQYFTSVWDECNCVVVWAFFYLALILYTGNSFLILHSDRMIFIIFEAYNLFQKQFPVCVLLREVIYLFHVSIVGHCSSEQICICLLLLCLQLKTKHEQWRHPAVFR